MSEYFPSNTGSAIVANLVVMAESLGDFHQLNLRHAQAVHGAGGVHVELQALQQLAGAPVQFLGVDNAADATRLAAQPDVLGHRHVGNGFQLLGDHRHPGSERCTGTVELHGLAVEQNGAGVTLGDAHEDTEESRFARAVAATQGVYAAGPQGEAPVAQGRNPGIGLGNVFSLEQ